GASLNERFHRLTLRDGAAEAVFDGGLAMEAGTAVIEAIQDMDALASLASYSGPVCLINEARDHFRMHENNVVDECADGGLVNVPRAGYMVNLDQPVNVSRIVADAADVVGVREAAAAVEGGSGSSSVEAEGG